MDAVCLTGQGKGRIEFAKGRHLFSYESLWAPNEDRWSLALSLPIIGQELLQLNFKESSFKKMATGTFANRLRNENKSPRTRELLGQFFKKFGELLTIFKTRELPKNQKGGDWNLTLKDNEFHATTSIGPRYNFLLKAFQWDKHYERVQVSLTKDKRTLLKLDLFVGSCNLTE